MPFDYVIKNGQIIDGTGAPGIKCDVGISAGSIEAVGDLRTCEAAEVIDATGQVVAPGFIDMHNHFDQTILLHPAAESAIAQGITTAVTGQCGFSPAPLNRHYTACFWEWNFWHKVEPRKYYQEGVADLDKVRPALKEAEGLDIDWKSFGEWLDRVRSAGPGVNLVPLVGHGTIRSAVLGMDYRRHATPDEVARMVRYAEEAMDDGAWGISNGMDYAPNAYCSPEESCQVIGACVRKGGFFSSHWRRTGLRTGFGNPGLINGIKEAIEVARRTGAKLQIAHLSPGYLVSPNTTPRLATVAAEETLAVLDEARKTGVDLAFDVIPNHLTGGVTHFRHLASMLSPWLKEAGSLEKFAENLRCPDLRDEIRSYIMAGKWFSLNPYLQPGWASATVVGKTSVPGVSGKSISEVAASRGVDPLEALMDVISEDPHTTRGDPPETNDEVKRVFFRHPLAMVGIDTFVVDDTREGRVPPYALPNPNTFGGMARFIRLYAREVLGLEEGIHRLTGLPAGRLGLTDRGVIAPGKRADVVVFNPDAVRERGTPEEPRRYPDGFSWVFVNGVPALARGKITGLRAGRVLTRCSA